MNFEVASSQSLTVALDTQLQTGLLFLGHLYSAIECFQWQSAHVTRFEN